MSDPRAEYSRLLDHLARLERELVTVRRELRDQRRTTTLPTTPFEALRIAVAGEAYALPSAAVRQIIRFAKLSRVPNAPPSVLGALNLRGEVVVVVDMSSCLGLGQAAIDLKTPVVIAVAHGHLIGLVVDRVLDVLTLDPQNLEEPSSAMASAVCVAAVGPVMGQLVQVLDVDQLLTAVELQTLEDSLTSDELDETEGNQP
jgi:purine-binding chemotaxis protein CheW